jgi:hypothetical protein
MDFNPCTALLARRGVAAGAGGGCAGRLGKSNGGASNSGHKSDAAPPAEGGIDELAANFLDNVFG